jgi:hypothetical protein
MTFTADTATYDVIDGAHIAGLAIGNGADGYLMLQRSGEDDPDDWGVYIELNDQADSGYGLVENCRVSRQAVEIDLTQPLAGTTTIHVHLVVKDDAYMRFVEGLKAIFRGDQKQLTTNA